MNKIKKEVIAFSKNPRTDASDKNFIKKKIAIDNAIVDEEYRKACQSLKLNK